jgi:hypothetical protein
MRASIRHPVRKAYSFVSVPAARRQSAVRGGCVWAAREPRLNGASSHLASEAHRRQGAATCAIIAFFRNQLAVKVYDAPAARFQCSMMAMNRTAPAGMLRAIGARPGSPAPPFVRHLHTREYTHSGPRRNRSLYIINSRIRSGLIPSAGYEKSSETTTTLRNRLRFRTCQLPHHFRHLDR